MSRSRSEVGSFFGHGLTRITRIELGATEVTKFTNISSCNFAYFVDRFYRLMTFSAVLSASMMSGMPPTMPTCTLSRRLK
jgi:hypothetical protein